MNGQQTVKKGESLFISCNATSSQPEPLDISWYKDGLHLKADRSGRVNITTHIFYGTQTIVSNITIKKAVAADDGVYECKTEYMTKNLTIEVTGEGSENVKSK